MTITHMQASPACETSEEIVPQVATLYVVDLVEDAWMQPGERWFVYTEVVEQVLAWHREVVRDARTRTVIREVVEPITLSGEQLPLCLAIYGPSPEAALAEAQLTADMLNSEDRAES